MECPLGDVLAELKNGLNCKQDKSGRGDRISRIESVSDGKFDDARVGYATLTDAERKRYRLKIGDILFSHINSPPHVGKTAIFESDTPIYHGVNLLLMRPIADVDSKFLFYFLVSLRATGYWAENCKKSVNQASVNQKDIARVAFKYPRAITEQRRIVAVLDEAFGAIVTATINAKKNLANAQKLFAAELEIQMDGTERGWDRKPLGELGKTVTGSTPKTTERSNYGNFMPFIKPGDFNQDGSLNYENEGLSEGGAAASRHIAAGSALMVCIGSIGKSAYVDKTIAANQQINALIPNPNLNGKFIYYQFLTAAFQRSVFNQCGQTTLPIINKSRWSELLAWAPALDEQQRIVERLDVMMQLRRQLEATYRRKIELLVGLKHSILRRALTGELTAITELESIAA
ncbi:restriction endonuclease subunit S [uncultured Sphingomonas sp.]|uniref:restriction endonuclease subunit S n=1 Tax=uncultured Sphingomonas sp. TaxID=158754 RepID=UPI00259AA93D|nr:restriction endonuclease subunit S [uncultured Sphingomonas sp.]